MKSIVDFIYGGILMSVIPIDYPENQGLSSKAILEFCNQIEMQKLEVNSFILLRNGKNIAEFWRRPYRKDCQQLLFSLTKSFTSIAVGIAWDNGYFDLSDQVISFFPDKLPTKITPNLDKMKVHHLLSMNTGHHDHNYFKINSEKDWVRAFLAIPPEHEPGTHYCYNTHAAHVLAAIVEKTTGQSMIDFLMPRLFEPLGITRPHWETGPAGITAGGMGLSIPTEGVAKFGQMLLDKGMYNGHRIVSEEYIRLATSQSNNSTHPEVIGNKQGYGYLFQLYPQGCFGHIGSFGQLCFVSPRDKVVIAVTSNKSNFQALSDLIYKYILDNLDKNSLRCTDDCNGLQERLANMNAIAKMRYIPEGIPNLKNRSYIMEQNPDNLERLNLSLDDKLLRCEFIYKEKDSNCLIFNFNEPVYTHDVFVKDISLHEQEVILYASWQDKETLELTMIYIETPYVATYLISFDKTDIRLSFKMNVSLRNLSPHSRSNYVTNGKMI